MKRKGCGSKKRGGLVPEVPQGFTTKLRAEDPSAIHTTMMSPTDIR